MKEKLICVLEELEKNNKNEDGYSAVEVINKLGMDNNENTQKMIRGKLRSLISIHKYDEFKTAGEEDIVYSIKYSGLYRLSKNYRNKNNI